MGKLVCGVFRDYFVDKLLRDEWKEREGRGMRKDKDELSIQKLHHLRHFRFPEVRWDLKRFALDISVRMNGVAVVVAIVIIFSVRRAFL